MKRNALARKNLDNRFAPIQALPIDMPSRGWIRAIRDALGLSTTQLARRIGVKQPRIVALEHAEANGTASLKSLRAAAEAMNCRFVYAIIPTTSLDAIMRARAAEKAEAELAHLHHTMALENQAMTKANLARERDRLIDELLAGSERHLWEDE